jgi:membrane protein YqaA with SNARE-associated domain
MTSKRIKTLRWIVLGTVVLLSVGFIVGAVLLVFNWDSATALRPHSYSGLLLASFIAGAPIPVFMPIAIIAFVLGSVLNPLVVGLVAGAGNLIGNMLTFYAGRGGFHAFSIFELPTAGENPDPSKLDQLIQRIKQSRMVNFGRRRRLPALLVLALLPTPLFMPTIFSLGAARSVHSHFWRVMAVSFVGQTVQAIIWASLGHFGLRSILDVFGVLSTG